VQGKSAWHMSAAGVEVRSHPWCQRLAPLRCREKFVGRGAGPERGVRKATDAGVLVFSGGLDSQRASVVTTDGTVTDGPDPETKGGHRRTHGLRFALARGGAGLGGQDGRPVPLCPEVRVFLPEPVG
jgi:hypothetical protein